MAAGQAGAGDGSQSLLGSRSPDNVWHFADKPGVTADAGTRGMPNAYMIVRLDHGALQASLARVSKRRHNAPLPVLTLPMPDGSFARFRIEAAPQRRVRAMGAKRPSLGNQTTLASRDSGRRGYGHALPSERGVTAVMNRPEPQSLSSKGLTTSMPQFSKSRTFRSEMTFVSSRIIRRDPWVHGALFLVAEDRRHAPGQRSESRDHRGDPER